MVCARQSPSTERYTVGAAWTVLEALKMAVWQRQLALGLVHDSDQGSQPGLNQSSQQCLSR
jgi:hypothetical protein